MSHLYEITGKYQELMSRILAADELSPEHTQEIGQIEDDIKEKAVAVAAFIKNLEADADAIEAAMKSMSDRLTRMSRKILHLRNYLQYNLENCGMKEIRTPHFDIKVRMNPPSVAIIDEKEIPEDYFREITTRRPDKTMLSRDLKNNMMIPGVVLRSEMRLEIK